MIIFYSEEGGITVRDKQKKRFNFRWIGWAFGIIGFMWMIIYFFPTTNSTKHAYFDHDRPLIIAHQGGEHLAPSGTLEAFKNAAPLGVDVIEFDKIGRASCRDKE